MALLVARAWLVLWPDHGLAMNSSGTESGIVLYPVCGVIGWPVMTCGVDCFVVRIKLSLLEFE